MIINPIITSILDNDLYTATVGQIAFKEFPTAKVKYKFINRGKTPLPSGFDLELRKQLEYMRNLSLRDVEYWWLDGLGHFSFDYLQYLKNYRFNPDELTITVVDGNLDIEIDGLWVSTIMWEVPLLALVSELNYKLQHKNKDEHWKSQIHHKARIMSEAGCKWMEFGTRRRFDYETQNEVVRVMKDFKGFLGTSNMLLAMLYNVPVLGTMSHQGPMAMQALHGATHANREWRKVWLHTYADKLLTFLPDTYTTDVFLRDFTANEAKVWNLRQDSGSPDEFLKKILAVYDKFGIDSTKKTVVLSDSLNADSFIDYTNRYHEYINIVGGIGTSLTNDVGHVPLSIVVKLSEADFGNGYVPVVKLSDTNGKHTGTPAAIAAVKQELGIV